MCSNEAESHLDLPTRLAGQRFVCVLVSGGVQFLCCFHHPGLPRDTWTRPKQEPLVGFGQLFNSTSFFLPPQNVNTSRKKKKQGFGRETRCLPTTHGQQQTVDLIMAPFFLCEGRSGPSFMGFI